MLSMMIDTPVGAVFVMAVTAYLLLFTHPVLGVLSIFVAYELLRKSTMVRFIPTVLKDQPKVDAQQQSFNPPAERTLEEDLVAQMAPIEVSADYVETGFKPVSEDVHGASVM
jgi:hypothetical protein